MCRNYAAGSDTPWPVGSFATLRKPSPATQHPSSTSCWSTRYETIFATAYRISCSVPDRVVAIPGLRNNARYGSCRSPKAGRNSRFGNCGSSHVRACVATDRTDDYTRANTDTHGSANGDAHADICTDGYGGTNTDIDTPAD